MAHTDEQKQLAITTYAACRNNATHAAKFCKEHYDLTISQEQILRWAKGNYIDPSVVRTADAVKQTLADKCEAVADKLLDALLQGYSEATFMQQATAFGIVSDKMLLFRGEANQINGISRDEAKLRLLEIIAQYGNQP